MKKCAIALCEKEAEWIWQPFGPGADSRVFAVPGHHSRGYAALPICDECKQTLIAGKPGLVFYYRETPFVALGGEIEETPF